MNSFIMLDTIRMFYFEAKHTQDTAVDWGKKWVTLIVEVVGQNKESVFDK